jgi:hypothetical protein
MKALVEATRRTSAKLTLRKRLPGILLVLGQRSGRVLLVHGLLGGRHQSVQHNAIGVLSAPIDCGAHHAYQLVEQPKGDEAMDVKWRLVQREFRRLRSVNIKGNRDARLACKFYVKWRLVQREFRRLRSVNIKGNRDARLACKFCTSEKKGVSDAYSRMTRGKWAGSTPRA